MIVHSTIGLAFGPVKIRFSQALPSAAPSIRLKFNDRFAPETDSHPFEDLAGREERYVPTSSRRHMPTACYTPVWVMNLVLK
jgi:hypothetical protein